MARTKKVPIVNVHEKRLKEFFKDAAKSTPDSPSPVDGSSTSPPPPLDSKSSKSSSGTSESTSKKSSSQKTSSTKSSSHKSLSGKSPSGKSSSGKRSSRKSSSRHSKKSASTEVKKRGMAALQEIRRLQKSTDLLIPAAAFIRVVRDVLRAEETKRRRDDAHLPNGFLLEGMKFSADALACLQEAAEVQLTNFFTLSYYCTMHAKRKTLMVRDCQLTRLILGRNDPMNP